MGGTCPWLPPWNCACTSLPLLLTLFLSSPSTTFVSAEIFAFNDTTPTGPVWVNDDTYTVKYTDGSCVRPILLRRGTIDGPSFACGFFCNGACDAFLFSIFLIYTDSLNSSTTQNSKYTPQLIWSANRNSPVKGRYVALRFMSSGALTLEDEESNVVWYPETSPSSSVVAGMNLTEEGNLVIFDGNGATLWQSFDHPTDTVLPQQSLTEKKLVANASATNTSEGLFSLYVFPSEFCANITLLLYCYNGSIKNGVLLSNSTLADTPAEAFMRFEADGHLRTYVWSKKELTWKMENDTTLTWTEKLSNGASRRWIILGSSIGGGLLVVFTSVGIVFMVRKKKDMKGVAKEEHEQDEEEREFLQIQNLQRRPERPTIFSFEELRSATGDFSKIIGEGGFGPVFEGTLGDGTRVAVKRLGYNTQGEREFIRELEAIGIIHHPNLVRLVGYCMENLNHILVYEFVSRGSLDKWIIHGKRSKPLDWPTKFKIILDVAKGLSFLHEDCRYKIIHLDIKPQNILLDHYFNAKISDFGLSKLVEKDDSQVFTTMKGTNGYLAPEWLKSVITEKVDVYSFGVVVLETVCAKKCLDQSRSEEGVHLATILQRALERNRILEIVDRDCPIPGCYEDQVKKMLITATWCLQGNDKRRPSMSQVVKVLEGRMGVDHLELSTNFFACNEVMTSSSTTPTTMGNYER